MSDDDELLYMIPVSNPSGSAAASNASVGDTTTNESPYAEHRHTEHVAAPPGSGLVGRGRGARPQTTNHAPDSAGSPKTRGRGSRANNSQGQSNRPGSRSQGQERLAQKLEHLDNALMAGNVNLITSLLSKGKEAFFNSLALLKSVSI